MRTADFDYELPPELIAQTPLSQRDQSRLLVLRQGSGQIAHRRFSDLLDYLRAGDVLVLNNSRVIPARLRGVNIHTGGQFEILLLEEKAVNDWWVMLRPGRRARLGTHMALRDRQGAPSPVHATVVETNDEGHRRLQFAGVPDIAALLEQLGEAPLPPYIRRPDASRREADRQRYQTVFAERPGSVAAPTAGLHFTESLLEQIRRRGVQVCFLTLHVGLGTFAPVKTETLAAHRMHEEHYELGEETARVINAAKQAGRRVLAVGTTTLRVLESVALSAGHTSRPAGRETSTPRGPIPGNRPDQRRPQPPATKPSSAGPTEARSFSVAAGSGRTRIFIFPPCDFKIADGLLTNFHLPRSTLLMLVSAFAVPKQTRGRDLVLAAYAEAVRRRYRFYSYGDAMLLL